jgi:hypothetical protein
VSFLRPNGAGRRHGRYEVPAGGGGVGPVIVRPALAGIDGIGDAVAGNILPHDQQADGAVGVLMRQWAMPVPAGKAIPSSAAGERARHLPTARAGLPSDAPALDPIARYCWRIPKQYFAVFPGSWLPQRSILVDAEAQTERLVPRAAILVQPGGEHRLIAITTAARRRTGNRRRGWVELAALVRSGRTPSCAWRHHASSTSAHSRIPAGPRTAPAR